METIEWKDCATDRRDCHALKNRCAMMQELAKTQGTYVENCFVNCCGEDLCNLFSATPPPAADQLGVKANQAERASESLVLMTAFFGIFMLRMIEYTFHTYLLGVEF